MTTILTPDLNAASKSQDFSQGPFGTVAEGKKFFDVHLRAQYLKDLSLENPSFFDLVSLENAPEMRIDLDIQTDQKDEHHFEITIWLRLKSIHEEKTLYLIEMQYAGLFEIKNVQEEQLPLLLFIQCPETLWPYVQHTIARLTMESGIPPFRLPMVNFGEFFYQKFQAAQKTEA